MTERETNVLNELEVVQGAVAQAEEWVEASIELPVIEGLEKADAFLAVGTCWGGGVAKYDLI